MTFHFSVFHHAFPKMQASILFNHNIIIAFETINNKGSWLAPLLQHAAPYQAA